MAELPEIIVLARQMSEELIGKTIRDVEVLQPKCLNVSPAAFINGLRGARILDVAPRGKWLFVETTQGWLLLSTGMGGEILYLPDRDHLPEKRRLVFDFTDGSCLSVNFWWFGYAHYVRPGELGDHAMTAKLGPNALDPQVNADWFRERFRGRRVRVKSFLLNQANLAGIGNAYIHDILFRARLHPLRPVNTLSDEEIEALVRAIHERFQASVEKGGAFWEVDLYGRKGRYAKDDLLIAYKEGQPCPLCGTPIEKIKTGSTSNFICPQCQPLA